MLSYFQQNNFGAFLKFALNLFTLIEVLLQAFS